MAQTYRPSDGPGWWSIKWSKCGKSVTHFGCGPDAQFFRPIGTDVFPKILTCSTSTSKNCTFPSSFWKTHKRNPFTATICPACSFSIVIHEGDGLITRLSTGPELAGPGPRPVLDLDLGLVQGRSRSRPGLQDLKLPAVAFLKKTYWILRRRDHVLFPNMAILMNFQPSGVFVEYRRQFPPVSSKNGIIGLGLRIQIDRCMSCQKKTDFAWYSKRTLILLMWHSVHEITCLIFTQSFQL